MSRFLIVLVFAALAGCSTAAASPSASDSPETATTSGGADVRAFAQLACGDTTYSRCVESVTQAFGFFGAGSLIAICEYEDGEGDVVLLDREEDAEDECTGGGLFPGQVFDVVTLPGE